VAYARDVGGRALLEARSFREVRRFYMMEVELDTPPLPAEWPPGIHVDSFRREDARGFFDAHSEAFAGSWGFRSMGFDEWLRFRVDSPRADHSLWFLARDGDEIAAVIRCDDNREDTGWVGALGVRPAWQRRGLGLALLLHALAEFRRRGKQRVGLGVDTGNPTGATRLYERAGMHVAMEDVVFEKALA
jgi:ribosomal protein S18 acetylase RimI-like enzyme